MAPKFFEVIESNLNNEDNVSTEIGHNRDTATSRNPFRFRDSIPQSENPPGGRFSNTLYIGRATEEGTSKTEILRKAVLVSEAPPNTKLRLVSSGRVALWRKTHPCKTVLSS